MTIEALGAGKGEPKQSMERVKVLGRWRWWRGWRGRVVWGRGVLGFGVGVFSCGGSEQTGGFLISGDGGFESWHWGCVRGRVEISLCPAEFQYQVTHCVQLGTESALCFTQLEGELI